ncbi:MULTISPECIES: CocE/NonD family hydrolase [unclassified Modestobacter]|uniref:CocE/NonD family hydrolase n=1 Tax=unclassified Modestobacter TaxID=2643866 RepID=UPI0022AAE0CD|nr:MULTISPECIES: CocE/NonD family hydrolase [unclassified Modestobacter]MCZ2826900.1 CocE/NonD family hydrolase [Modestobacter sp. VKM Ac-2981]MCZ2855404.1 CocE/NonD family hydrolase [Modestobacter sp. VKM Ac-2982]
MFSRRTRRLGVIGTITGAVVAGVLAPPAAAHPPRPAPAAEPDWFDYDRPAAYGTHVERLQVPMQDGFELGCTIARPALGGEPAAGEFPGLLRSYTPYGRAVEEAEGEFATYFSQRGYNVMSCDIRGTGISPAPGFEARWPIQSKDGHDAVEWLAEQPWSSGKVGASGTSYGGQTTLEIAAEQPPHLVAIAPNVSPMENYSEIFYPGGARADADWLWVGAPDVADPAFDQRQLDAFAAHPTYDEYWDVQNVANEHEDIEVPVLLTGGWFDVFRAGAIGNYEGLRDAGNDDVRLVMGPWTHADPWEQETEPLPIGATLAWFDHWLRDDPDAPLPAAPVTSYEVEGTGGRWVELADWPADGNGQVLALGTDRELDRRPGKPGTLDLAIDPDDGPATTCLVGCPRPTDPAADNAAADEGRLTFTSDPLAHDAVMAGQAEVTLEATLPASDGNLVAKVMDVAPDGRVTEVAAGWLRASHRFGHDRSVPVTPGEETTFVIETQPAHWRFAEGHRVRISLMTGDVPRIAPDDSTGTIDVAAGARGSVAEIEFTDRARFARTPAA